MKLLMSDYEVTLVNDNMQVSSNVPRREGESSAGANEGREEIRGTSRSQSWPRRQTGDLEQIFSCQARSGHGALRTEDIGKIFLSSSLSRLAPRA